MNGIKKEKNYISWMTSDTCESIPVSGNGHRETFTVYLVCPDGKMVKEENYQGDGVFGGQNVFELFAHWNFADECTGDAAKDAEIGFRHYFNNSEKVKHQIIIIKNPDSGKGNIICTLAKKGVSRVGSEVCEFQGWFYADAEVIEKDFVKTIDDYVIADAYSLLMSGPIHTDDKDSRHIFTDKKMDQVATSLFSRIRRALYLAG